MKDTEILHIFVEIMNGRGRHGDFLRSFSEAVARADESNFALIKPTAELIVEKFGLAKYLDNIDGGEAKA